MLVLDLHAVSDLAKALRAGLAGQGHDLRLTACREAVSAALAFGSINALDAAARHRLILVRPEGGRWTDLPGVGADGPAHAAVLEQLARAIRHRHAALPRDVQADRGLAWRAAALSAACAVTTPPMYLGDHAGAARLIVRPEPEVVEGAVVVEGVGRDEAVAAGPHRVGLPSGEMADLMARNLANRRGVRLVSGDARDLWMGALAGVALARGRHVAGRGPEYEAVLSLLRGRRSMGGAQLADEYVPLPADAWLSDVPVWQTSGIAGVPGAGIFFNHIEPPQTGPGGSVVAVSGRVEAHTGDGGDAEWVDGMWWWSFAWDTAPPERVLAALLIQTALHTRAAAFRTPGRGLDTEPPLWLPDGGPVVRASGGAPLRYLERKEVA